MGPKKVWKFFTCMNCETKYWIEEISRPIPIKQPFESGIANKC